MADIINQATGEYKLDGKTYKVESNEVILTEKPKPKDLEMIKITNVQEWSSGDTIPWTIKIKNPNNIIATNFIFKDLLDPKTSYVPPTFQVDGVTKVPMITGQQIAFQPITVPANGEVVVTFSVIAN